MAFADAFCSHYGHIGYRVAAAEECHGAGSRVGEAVGQEVEKLAKLVSLDGSEAGGQVGDGVSGHLARQPVVETIGETAADAGLGASLARPYCHVIALVEFLQQSGYISRIVLSIGIHEDKDIALCCSGTALDGGAIAHAVGMADYFHTAVHADGRGVVGRTIVHHDDFTRS